MASGSTPTAYDEALSELYSLQESRRRAQLQLAEEEARSEWLRREAETVELQRREDEARLARAEERAAENERRIALMEQSIRCHEENRRRAESMLPMVRDQGDLGKRVQGTFCSMSVQC